MSARNWVNISLFNLLLVASLGVTLRYKIAFYLPFVDQKNLLHSHSHFAFSGWITQALMTLMVMVMAKQAGATISKKYHWVLMANLLTAYGMLISFIMQGYGFFSILFSTLSIFASYAFCILYWRDINKLAIKKISHYWFKAALLFNVISSIGAFGLAFIMATKNAHQHLYLSAIYFFLHFQYNGWFLFACMGFATGFFFQGIASKIQRLIFWLFAGACVPAYLLSTLWWPLPQWAYYIVVAAAFAQAGGWVLMTRELLKTPVIKSGSLNLMERSLFLLAAVAFSIKLMLQLGSTVPFLSKLAFGFRPIVIGYLHLILLGVISIFIIGFMVSEKFIMVGRTVRAGLNLFIAGIIINEIFLMVQGIAAINYTLVPGINEMLLGAATLIFSGMLVLNIGLRKN